MSTIKKISPEMVKYVEGVGCSGDCNYTLEINKGLPLPCKAWTNEESRILRELMLMDNELMNSGMVRQVDRSALGDSLRIKIEGMDVGRVRTFDSGAYGIEECETTYQTITFTDYEKWFYVVKAELNTRMCTKQFIGKRQQDLISDQYKTYEIAEEFADTDLADMIIAKKIEVFRRFLPKFMLLASGGAAGEDMHGDDGILAKAWYASNKQYLHTLKYDMAEVETGFNSIYINAIVGGDKYDKAPTDFPTADQYLLDFTTWLNTRKEKRQYMFNTSIDVNTNELVVVSTFVTRDIDLRIVLNDGTPVDWGCIASADANQLAPLCLQQRIPVNDSPLMFQYENIDETNFFNKFKNYKKEFMRYLHRNGWPEATINDIRIGIDPELMLERQDYLETQTLEGNFNADTLQNTGFNFGQFVPLNALNDTGLFFMTLPGNLLLFSDGTNMMSMTENMRIKESHCGKPGVVEILGGIPPIGSSVEHFGAFASNLADSWFVLENKLDDRQPYANTMKNLACYDDNVKNHCLVDQECNITASVSYVASYNDIEDETTITVDVDAFLNTDGAITYDTDYSLSDGTGQTGITTPQFVITLPGDLTNSGLGLNVNSEVTGVATDGGACKTYVNFSDRLGEGDGFVYCTYSNTNNQDTNTLETDLNLQLTIDGSLQGVYLTDSGLSYEDVGDHPAIELEIEAIIPGSICTITTVGRDYTMVIENVPSFIQGIFLASDGFNQTPAFDQDC